MKSNAHFYRSALLTLSLLTLQAHAADATFGGGLSIPSKTFASTGSDDAGYAELGLHLSGAFITPLHPYLDWATSLTYHRNQTNASIESVEVGTWQNFTLLTGLRRKFNLNAKLQPFIAAHVGGNMAIFPSRSNSKISGGAVADADPATAIAFGFSGGVTYDKKYEFEVSYLDLGTPQASYLISTNRGDTGAYELGTPINMIQATFAMRFSLDSML
ncbi:MAG: hypothetical protein HQL49_09425 [Gammaproteobacteria bacterium]|nr:hypothetical protein [Gammaproteobacteria bacterium]